VEPAWRHLLHFKPDEDSIEVAEQEDAEGHNHLSLEDKRILFLTMGADN
jgi:hypothetical protein